MTPWLEPIFTFINFAIMPLWFGLLVMPRKKWVSPAIDTFAVVAATLYVLVLIPGLKEAFPVILKPTIPTVAHLLSLPEGVVCGWTHFVIADLWVGRWITQDSYRENIPHLMIVPILILTLLFGPAGLLAYFLTRLGFRRGVRKEA